MSESKKFQANSVDAKMDASNKLRTSLHANRLPEDQGYVSATRITSGKSSIENEGPEGTITVTILLSNELTQGPNSVES